MSIPRDFGAHGSAPSFSGPNGLSKTQEVNPFGNAGAREGGPSPIPAEARQGAMQCDESCREYTGNPRDGGGPLGPSAAPNRMERAGLTPSRDS